MSLLNNKQHKQIFWMICLSPERLIRSDYYLNLIPLTFSASGIRV
ncbi:hypothetical protein BH10CYA1_BH10CYA1_17830 [soil metagenome]